MGGKALIFGTNRPIITCVYHRFQVTFEFVVKLCILMCMVILNKYFISTHINYASFPNKTARLINLNHIY